jgi:histidinol-phosphate aminotransferase
MRNYTFDLEAMAAAVTPETRIIYIANPNNPTGTAFGAAEFDEFLKKVPGDVLVVLDEAYTEYAKRRDLPRAMEIFKKYNNLLTLKTFSKVYGLAGLRIGYGIGHPTLVAEMNKLRTPFNVTSVGQAAALAALDDAEHVRRSVTMNHAERARLMQELGKSGLKAVASETNFLFVPVTGMDAKGLCDELLKEGVIVRPMGWMGFPGAIRISVGNEEENSRLLAAVAKVMARRKSVVAPVA